MTDEPTLEEHLSTLFGDTRAEWLGERIFDLFTEPAYFPELEKRRPCVLVGGRGTGKTTVLRGLSYEGRYALTPSAPPSTWSYFGLYYKVNTNRVTAFSGPELSDNRWARIFGHYINLILCDSISRFMLWYEDTVGTSAQADPEGLSAVCESLHVEPAEDYRGLSNRIKMALIRFESIVNNIGDRAGDLKLSAQGLPIDLLCELIGASPEFSGKAFYFLIDEYESLSPLQQRVLNTLIKHCGERYSFKIGVRALGWDIHETLKPGEILESPADYARIDISERLDEDRFGTFALDVCNNRLRYLSPDFTVPTDITALFPGLSDDAEASHWGIEDIVSEPKEALLESFPESAFLIRAMDPLEIYFLHFWAKGANTSIEIAFKDFLASPESWRTRYGNYKHSLLYTLRSGLQGVRTRKLYAGWHTYANLAGGNIRYLLALVYRGLVQHLVDAEDGELADGVSFETQTTAAKKVARERLEELEGLSADGTTLAQLVTGLGKIFGTMAAQAEGHAPEVTQFCVTRNASSHDVTAERVDKLLRAGVMLLALRRFAGTKPTGRDDIHQYDYMLHPLFSALFDFSYRKKRRTELGPADIMGLIESQRQTVVNILSRSNRKSDETLFGDQLMLFGT